MGTQADAANIAPAMLDVLRDCLESGEREGRRPSQHPVSGRSRPHPWPRPARKNFLGGSSSLQTTLFRQLLRISLLALALASLASCGATTAGGGVPVSFMLTSAGFAEGAAIPAKYTCDGQNIAPPLRWEAPPAARGFVL